MKLSSYLDSKFVFLDLKSKNIEDVVKEMIDGISKSNQEIKEINSLAKELVLKREKEISTAIGSGIAIPHARIENFDDFIISIGVLKEPIVMNVAGGNTSDNVTFVVLILSDILKNKNILKTMSAISKMALKKPDLLKKLKQSASPKDLIKLIDEADIEIIHKIIADDLLSTDTEPVEADTTLDEIAKRFILEKTSGLPVVDKEGNFLGEITERELIEYGMPKYTSLLDDLNFLTVGEPFEEYLLNEKTATIKDIFRKENLNIIDRKAPIMEICSIMVKKGATRLYVLEGKKYIGMVKRSDIIKKVLHL
ncbi:MAG: PTS sugar transporter subunit IIA [Fusobacteriaceae bacterium]